MEIVYGLKITEANLIEPYLNKKVTVVVSLCPCYTKASEPIAVQSEKQLCHSVQKN